MTEVRGQKSEVGGQKSARRHPSSVVRRLIKWTLLTVAGLVVLILLLWAGLQTQWAKKELAGFIADVTEKTGDYRVEIEGLNGLLPFSITLKQATISDAKGPWLKMEQFDFSMKPWDLISGLVHVKWLRMEHLTISRLPESREPAPKKEKTPTKSGAFSLPHILVQEIRLQRIDLGEALAGKPMAFSLNSRLKTAKDRIQAEASLLDLNRDDNAFKLKAAYGLKNEHLTADMTYHESKGGLVAGLLGLKDLEDIQLTATAQGPVSHMKGDLNLNMGGYGNAALQYDVSHQETVTLQLSGQIKADSRIMPPRVARVITSETMDLTLNGSLSPAKEVLLKELEIKTGSMIISLEGAADLEKEKMDMRVLIEGAELTPFLTGTGISLDGLRPVSISATGPFMAPEVNISTALAGFKTQDATVNETTLNIRALFENRFTGLKSASVALAAQKLGVQQAPKLQGPLKVEIEAQSPDFSTWQVKALNMTLPGAAVNVKKALMNLTEGRFSGDLGVQVDHIAVLMPPDAPPLDGRLSIKAQVNIKKSIFDVAYRMNLDHLIDDISKATTLPVGDVQSQGKISGKFDDFEAHVNLNSRRLRVKNLEIKGMKTELHAKGLPQKPVGTIRLEASAMDQPLQVNSDFAWNGKTLTVGNARVQAPGIDLAASLDMTPGTEDFSGKIKGRITSLEIIQALTGVEAQGAGSFQIEADKTITLDANFKDLKYRDYGASTLNVTARVDDLKKMQGKASLKATNMPFRSSRLETLSLGAKGALSGAEITLETKGMVKTATEAPLFLATKIRVKRTNLWQLRLNTLKAGDEGLKVNLQKPATLTYDDDGRIALDDLQLKMDKGLLQAMAHVDPEKVDATVRITDLPLSLLEPFVGQDLDGTAEVSLELSGPLGDPGVNVAVHIKEYKVMGHDGAQPILLNVKLHSRRDGERLLADLELSGLGETPFKAGGSIPAHISLKPFAFDMDKNGRLEATLQGVLNLAVLQTLPAMDNQSLRGLVNVDMGIGGSLEKWELNGGVTLEKGRYENVEQGVLLDQIQVKMSAEGRILRLAHLTATDGGTGTISLNGRTHVDPPFRTEIALILKQATLLRQEDLTVTAGGNLDLKGNKERMDLTGEINLDRMEFNIPKRFPPDVTVIPVTIINDPTAEASEKSKSNKGETLIQMDMGVNIPDKCFVRGRGLDVEFKGRLTIRGPADNPVVRGTLNVVRGTFLCLSRTFKVISGQIAFDGATPPVPFLNINTQVNAGEITAQVDVSGPADAFKLKLSSQPSLPQDEIMAQILFGQSVAKLNTFQALQLAYSVNELAGGYGPDVMGKTRSFLGLDRLNFNGGDENGKNNGDDSDNSPGPSVSMGKYVTDRVYVGIEQDITDAKQDVVVEVNITPNFTVESKTGTRSGAGLGFNWNYDY
ncbi:MAG: translocation/assembly module TamB domain-containing protein [Deltaproteobacteria bacterium]|nr:translocation/assembly module TamB domain-containing protein [Deltaproteobacteria bacterium]